MGAPGSMLAHHIEFLVFLLPVALMFAAISLSFLPERVTGEPSVGEAAEDGGLVDKVAPDVPSPKHTAEPPRA